MEKIIQLLKKSGVIIGGSVALILILLQATTKKSVTFDEIQEAQRICTNQGGIHQIETGMAGTVGVTCVTREAKSIRCLNGAINPEDVAYADNPIGCFGKSDFSGAIITEDEVDTNKEVKNKSESED